MPSTRRRSRARSRRASSRRTAGAPITSCSPARIIRCCRRISSASRHGRSRYVDPAPAIARRVDALLGPAAAIGRARGRPWRIFTSGEAPPAPLRESVAALRTDRGSRPARPRFAIQRALTGSASRPASVQAKRKISCARALASRFASPIIAAPDYLIDQVELDVSLDRRATRVVSILSIRPNPAGRAGAALALDGDELEARSASRSMASRSIPTATSASPDGPDPREPAANARSRCASKRELDPAGQHQADGPLSLGLGLLHAMRGRRLSPDHLFPRSAGRALDLSRRGSRRIRAEAPVLLANGNLEARGDMPRRGTAISRSGAIRSRSLAISSPWSPAISAHIADRFVTASGREVALAIYVEHGRRGSRRLRDGCAQARDGAGTSRLTGANTTSTSSTSSPSPISIWARWRTRASTSSTTNTCWRLPETATDDDYAGIEGVIAHEYFHNWTGNRITCRDWFQLCLKEGLTVFRDQDFSADERSAPVERIGDVRALRAAQFPEDAGPLAHNVRPEVYHEINNFYTATVYQKGAEVVRMLKRLIGAAAFRAGMDLYFERYDGTAATVEDFIALFRRSLRARSHRSSCAGTVRRARRWSRSAAPMTRPRKTLTLDIAQIDCADAATKPAKLPLTIPIALGLVDADGRRIRAGLVRRERERTRERRVRARRRRAADRLRRCAAAGRPCRCCAGFSAPVRVDDDLTEERSPRPARATTATVSIAGRRRRAWRRGFLLRAVAAIRAGGAPESNGGFVAGLSARLVEDVRAGRIDPAFAALALSLPSEADIAREMARDVDPDAIHRRARGPARRARPRPCGALCRAHDEPRRRRTLQPRRGERRPARLAQRRRSAMLAAGERSRGRRAGAAPVGRSRQHDRALRRAGRARRSFRAPSASMPSKPFARAHAADPLILDKWFALQAQIPERRRWRACAG